MAVDDVLAGLVHVLLMRLVDDHLGRQPEGEALLKVSRVLMWCEGDVLGLMLQAEVCWSVGWLCC